MTSIILPNGDELELNFDVVAGDHIKLEMADDVVPWQSSFPCAPPIKTVSYIVLSDGDALHAEYVN